MTELQRDEPRLPTLAPITPPPPGPLSPLLASADADSNETETTWRALRTGTHAVSFVNRHEGYQVDQQLITGTCMLMLLPAARPPCDPQLAISVAIVSPALVLCQLDRVVAVSVAAYRRGDARQAPYRRRQTRAGGVRQLLFMSQGGTAKTRRRSGVAERSM